MKLVGTVHYNDVISLWSAFAARVLSCFRIQSMLQARYMKSNHFIRPFEV